MSGVVTVNFGARGLPNCSVRKREHEEVTCLWTNVPSRLGREEEAVWASAS